MDPNKNVAGSRVAMVTGASGAIGSAVVRRLAAEGWKVAGVDLRDARADICLGVDVTDRAAMVKAAREISEKLGPIELLVTAAGDYQKEPIGEMAISRWQRMLDVWLGGTANACAAVAPSMVGAGDGTIIVLSADLRCGGRGNAYVAAASGTLAAFVKSFGCEVAADGVRVNCLAVPPPANPAWVAETVSFLSNHGQYYAGQVIFLNSEFERKRGGPECLAETG